MTDPGSRAPRRAPSPGESGKPLHMLSRLSVIGVSLAAQRDYWIGVYCATRRQIAGCQGDEDHAR
jgi:hypothetical protein